MSKQRVYVAGPMTGLPDFNYPAFNAEAQRLRGLGYQVENPAENPAQDTWQAYMRQAVAQLVTCDLVALLPGWENSRGALIENGLAVSLGIPVVLAAEVHAVGPDPECWFCEGVGMYAGEPCSICVEPIL